MTQDWSKMKVADLKKALEDRGLDSKGLKADLVARLEAHEEEGPPPAEGADAAPVEGGDGAGEEGKEEEKEEAHAQPAEAAMPEEGAPEEAAAAPAADGGEGGKRAREEEEEEEVAGEEGDASKRAKVEGGEDAPPAYPADDAAAPPAYSDAAQQQWAGGDAAAHAAAAAAAAYPGYDAAAYAQQAAGEVPEFKSIVIEVPNDKVGLVIGRGGCTIKELEMKSGCRVQITPDTIWQGKQMPRPIQLQGYQQQLEYCKGLVAEKVGVDVATLASEQVWQGGNAGGPGPHPAAPVVVAGAAAGGQGKTYITQGGPGETVIHVPNESVGLVIGKQGSTIKYLEQTTNARIQIAKECPQGSNMRPITLSGHQQSVDQAVALIKGKVNDGPAGGGGGGAAGYNQGYGGYQQGYGGYGQYPQQAWGGYNQQYYQQGYGQQYPGYQQGYGQQQGAWSGYNYQQGQWGQQGAAGATPAAGAAPASGDAAAAAPPPAYQPPAGQAAQGYDYAAYGYGGGAAPQQ